MHLFDLLESKDACALPDLTVHDRNWWRRKFPALPNQDDIKIVGPMDVGAEPVADYCLRSLQCNYAEDLTSIDINHRWYEAIDQTQLFHLVSESVSFDQFLSGSQLYHDLLAAANSDIFVPVIVDRTAANFILGGCSVQCYPRSISLDLVYYQVTPHVKRLVSATLVYADFDKDATNTAYTFHVSLMPLDYIGIITNFAFDRNVFLIIFTVLGIFATGTAAILWILARYDNTTTQRHRCDPCCSCS